MVYLMNVLAVARSGAGLLRLPACGFRCSQVSGIHPIGGAFRATEFVPDRAIGGDIAAACWGDDLVEPDDSGDRFVDAGCGMGDKPSVGIKLTKTSHTK